MSDSEKLDPNKPTPMTRMLYAIGAAMYHSESAMGRTILFRDNLGSGHLSDEDKTVFLPYDVVSYFRNRQPPMRKIDVGSVLGELEVFPGIVARALKVQPETIKHLYQQLRVLIGLPEASEHRLPRKTGAVCPPIKRGPEYVTRNPTELEELRDHVTEQIARIDDNLDLLRDNLQEAMRILDAAPPVTALEDLTPKPIIYAMDTMTGAQLKATYESVSARHLVAHAAFTGNSPENPGYEEANARFAQQIQPLVDFQVQFMTTFSDLVNEYAYARCPEARDMHVDSTDLGCLISEPLDMRGITRVYLQEIPKPSGFDVEFQKKLTVSLDWNQLAFLRDLKSEGKLAQYLASVDGPDS